MNDIKEFFHLSLANDEKTIINQIIIKVVYKINLNKIIKINEILNRVLQQLVNVVIKQIRFLFDKYIKENIQSLHFKKSFYNNIAKV